MGLDLLGASISSGVAMRIPEGDDAADAGHVCFPGQRRSALGRRSGDRGMCTVSRNFAIPVSRQLRDARKIFLAILQSGEAGSASRKSQQFFSSQ
jgi:hypothetical protein